MKYSINTKLFLMFAILIFSLVSLILILNSTMLESFYLYKKEHSIINLYSNISELYTSGETSISSLTSQFEKLEANRNIDLVIKSKSGTTIYVTSKDYSSGRMLFNHDIPLNNTYIEKQLSTSPYFIERYYDNFLSSEFLVLIGYLNDRKLSVSENANRINS